MSCESLGVAGESLVVYRIASISFYMLLMTDSTSSVGEILLGSQRFLCKTFVVHCILIVQLVLSASENL